GSSEGWSNPEIGGLSFTTIGGASCPKAGAGASLCESSCACPLPLFVCATASIAPSISHSDSSRQPVLRIFFMRSLGDNNGISWLQDEVLINRFPLDQLAVVHGNFLLFAALVAQQ